VPPSSAYQWSGNANSSAWSVGGNWVGGAAPTLNADVLFGDLPSNGPEVAVNVNNGSKTLKALWFDAGKWYNLSGAALTLGGGLASGAPVITVNADWSGMSEINIDNTISFNFGAVIGANPRLLEITNHSEGGLRLGGTVSFSNGDFQGFSFLRVGGHGATHFANTISGTGFIVTNNNQTTHLVLSGDNTNWRGVVNVTAESLAFIKRNNALPGIGWGGNSLQARAGVISGGTLGFRSHGHGPSLNYSSNHRIQVEGQGAVRQWGLPPVGAVYNDGGQNTFRGDIQMAGDTSFGSRGDRNGGLTLTGQITGNYSFTKVGPGLITLTNTNNTWTGNTYLNGGALRLQTLGALPGTSSIRFNGGILELEGSATPYFYGLGSAGGQVQWDGSGGFSVFGGPTQGAHIGIGGTNLFQLPSLQWGQNGFVPVGKELLLSSRYASAPVVLWNGIDATGATIRVERGLTADAWAAIGGQITAGNGGDFTKRGLGFLALFGSNNNYSAQTIIEQGALGGTISPNSNIVLRGGVVMLGNLNNANPTTFTRSVGTAPGQIQWNGGWFDQSTQQWVNGGGFAAWSGDQTVKLNNNTAAISMSYSTSYGFGHYTASGTVIWDNKLTLEGATVARIQVERGRDLSRADVVFNQEFIGLPQYIAGQLRYPSMWLSGDGRMDIQVDNPNYEGSIRISGLEFRVHRAGKFPLVRGVSIQQGGILTLDNRGKHDSVTGGYYLINRLPFIPIFIEGGGSLRLWGRADYSNSTLGHSTIPTLSHVVIGVGAVSIDLTQNNSQSYTQLQINTIQKTTFENSGGEDKAGTLNLTSNVSYAAGDGQVSLRVSNWGDLVAGIGSGSLFIKYEINDSEEGDKIIPWATVKGRDWVMPRKSGNYTYLIALPQYHTNIDTTTWDLSRNVSVSTQATLGSHRTINSLRLIGQANLGLDKFDLTLNSGGLLSYGKNTITSNSGARLMGVQGVMGEKTQRPFYAHIYNGHLEIAGRTQIHSDYEFVKTGDGTLILNSAATHYFGKSLYISQGTLSLRQGRMQVGTKMNEGIYIGDSSGVDILELPANSWDPIIGIGEFPSIFLKGKLAGVFGAAHYDSNNESILRMGGNTKLHLDMLTVEGNAIIDWHGGEVGKANILWIDNLIFASGTERLFMWNWYQYEDVLLVKKGGFMKAGHQVIFEGYEDFPVLLVDYDANYWQITPFHSPEPSTYGAILGGVGLVLWGWRRKSRRAVSDIHLARRTDRRIGG